VLKKIILDYVNLLIARIHSPRTYHHERKPILMDVQFSFLRFLRLALHLVHIEHCGFAASRLPNDRVIGGENAWWCTPNLNMIYRRLDAFIYYMAIYSAQAQTANLLRLQNITN
jgi:hypothetical protein